MRTTACLWALAALALVTSACSGSDARAPDAQAPLTLDLRLGNLVMPEESDGEPVTFFLVNAGTSPAHVNSRLLVDSADRAHEIVLQVLGPDKRPRRVEALTNAANTSRAWKVLAPGQRVFNTAKLADLFDLSEKGFYSVQAVYENDQDAPAGTASLPAWKGRVASAVLRFERK